MCCPATVTTAGNNFLLLLMELILGYIDPDMVMNVIPKQRQRQLPRSGGGGGGGGLMF